MYFILKYKNYFSILNNNNKNNRIIERIYKKSTF